MPRYAATNPPINDSLRFGWIGDGVVSPRHSRAMRSIESGISRFPDAQLRIWGLMLTHHPGMTHSSVNPD
jgi:hypothetical protein